MGQLRSANVPEKIVRALKALKNRKFTEADFWPAVEKQIGPENTREYKPQVLASLVPQYGMGHYGEKEAKVFTSEVYETIKALPSFSQYGRNHPQQP
jgi:hypothetical protein